MGKVKEKQYYEMTREELEEAAKEQGVPGRSTKSKEELIHALETWQGRPQDEHSELHRKDLDELRRIAERKNIPDIWEMDKEQLITAIQTDDNLKE